MKYKSVVQPLPSTCLGRKRERGMDGGTESRNTECLWVQASKSPSSLASLWGLNVISSKFWLLG